MGLPKGFITAVSGITRNDMHRLAGNGVMPQQAVHALRQLLGMQRPPARGGSGPGVSRATCTTG